MPSGRSADERDYSAAVSGALIFELRTYLGETQGEFARRLTVSQARLSCLERGTSVLSLRHCRTLAKFIDGGAAALLVTLTSAEVLMQTLSMTVGRAALLDEPPDMNEAARPVVRALLTRLKQK